MDDVIKVSCIITTRNEEKNIRACLDSIRNQTYPKEAIEIVVVDNNSVDNTVSIAKQYTDKVFTFGPERSAQRNFGIKSSSGKYILYLDADMILSKDVTKECVDKCEREGLSALYIPERIIGKGFWIKVRDFERSFYNATVIDCVRFVRRDKFSEIGGFDETLTGPEDWDFNRRIRKVGAIGIINSYLYHDEGAFNLKKYLSKKSYYADSFRGYISKWGKDDPEIKKQLGFWYRYVEVFFEGSKWLKLIRYPFLTSAMYFLRFLVGFSYLLTQRAK